MKNGFTLVELSIVLVIIGLLIGGILVGQSLIDSAKIQQAIRQIQQYDIAVSNFRGKFKSMPGDSNLFLLAGDNDGMIEQTDIMPGVGVPECGVANCTEDMSFWRHLTDSSILKGSYTSGVIYNRTDAQDYAPNFIQDNVFLSSIYYTIDNGTYGSKGHNYGSYTTFFELNDLLALHNKFGGDNAAYLNDGSYAQLGAGDIRFFCDLSTNECEIAIKMLSDIEN